MFGPTSLFKFIIYFSISFVILSFPIDNKPIFMNIYQKTKNVTAPIYGQINTASKTIWNKVARYSHRVFENATPKMDSVNIESSSWDRGRPIESKISRDEIDEESDSAPSSNSN